MSEMGVQPAATAGPAAEAPGLTQWQRIVYTFSAPSKTFEDIKRGNRSWWLPLILMALAGYLLFGAVVQRIGIQQSVENQIKLSQKAQDQMAQASPEQRDKIYKFYTGLTDGIFISAPAVGMLYAVVIAALFLGTINFGFGGKAKFSEIFAVIYYAWLPGIVKVLLGVVVIYAGVAPESFNIKNFAPTNPGAFLDPVETNKFLYTLATSLDAVTIWTLVLLGIGVAKVAGVKRGSGLITVFLWWAVYVLLGMVGAAFSG